jgi:hypothetical protein
MSRSIVTPAQKSNFSQPNNAKFMRREAVGYDYVPVPSGIHKAKMKSGPQQLWTYLLGQARRGIFDPSNLTMARALGKSVRQIIRWKNWLIANGWLQAIKRRLSQFMNHTNLYKILGLEEGGDKNVIQKIRKVLNTTTPPRENPRAAYEARREQDRKDRERIQRQHEEKASFWEKCKQTRVYQAIARDRRLSEACVGMWRGESTEWTPAEVEAFKKRDAERPKTLLELIRAGGGL